MSFQLIQLWLVNGYVRMIDWLPSDPRSLLKMGIRGSSICNLFIFHEIRFIQGKYYAYMTRFPYNCFFFQIIIITIMKLHALNVPYSSSDRVQTKDVDVIHHPCGYAIICIVRAKKGMRIHMKGKYFMQIFAESDDRSLYILVSRIIRAVFVD